MLVALGNSCLESRVDSLIFQYSFCIVSRTMATYPTADPGAGTLELGSEKDPRIDHVEDPKAHIILPDDLTDSEKRKVMYAHHHLLANCECLVS
jgi:hypothetical protein